MAIREREWRRIDQRGAVGRVTLGARLRLSSHSTRMFSFGRLLPMAIKREGLELQASCGVLALSISETENMRQQGIVTFQPT
jgi:hypothetical protein